MPKYSMAAQDLFDSYAARRMEAGLFFSRLYSVASPAVKGVCFGYFGNIQDAEDLTQETFTKAMRRISSYRNESMITTWLIAIAERLCISEQRRRKRRRKFYLDDEADLLNLRAGRSCEPDYVMEAKELGAALDASLQKLSPEFRAAFERRYLHDDSYAAHSSKSKIPVGTAKSRVCRAKAALRRDPNLRRFMADGNE